MNASLERLLADIGSRLKPRAHAFIVGGSGKSTLARELCARLEPAQVVTMDDFWVRERDPRSSDWDSFDRTRLERQVLRPARDGCVVRYRVHDWSTGTLGGWRELPRSGFLIVEGNSAVHNALVPYCDFAIWVDCSLEIAEARGLARGVANGINESEIQTTRWGSNLRDSLQKCRPDRMTDFVSPTGEVAP